MSRKVVKSEAISTFCEHAKKFLDAEEIRKLEIVCQQAKIPNKIRKDLKVFEDMLKNIEEDHYTATTEDLQGLRRFITQLIREAGRVGSGEAENTQN